MRGGAFSERCRLSGVSSVVLKKRDIRTFMCFRAHTTETDDDVALSQITPFDSLFAAIYHIQTNSKEEETLVTVCSYI